ncbi:hypothetical protein PSTG_15241 [Puccinia striiformis f. sp. tritici PST-78]|uniref:Uncharacterized protein n=1 Tax=Puccinia striiformis f. sp. tritici PST-78 TaxID=1165861 RepID=A0A0L0UWB3_9BASI|nr:hypothetical protein PSTG_15241 [Puccinia striiformis f. sp. tritici PST-78]
MRIVAAQHPWLLGATFILMYYSKYSSSHPPTILHAEAEPLTIDALGHVLNSSWDEFDRPETISDLQAINLRTRITPDVSGDLADDFQIWRDILKAKDVETAISLMGDSNDGSINDTMSPIIPVQLAPQAGSSAGSKLAVGQTASVSKKRSREESEAHNDNQSIKEKQTENKQIQGVLNLADDRIDSIRYAPDDKNQPRDFEIMRSETKWDPLFAWAKAASGETRESPIMKNFVERFAREEAKLNTLLPFQQPHEKIGLNNMPLELHLTNGNLHSRQESREFLIQLTGLRGAGNNYVQRVYMIKNRIFRILEALGLFHGLAVSRGMNTQILRNLEDLVEWFWGIFFEETVDGPPLFGLFKGTWEAAEKAGNRFGSVKREISMVIANSQGSKFNTEVKLVALSLLGYRCSMNASSNGGPGIRTDHTQIFWENMAQISQGILKTLEKKDLVSAESQEGSTMSTRSGSGRNKIVSNHFSKLLNTIHRTGLSELSPDSLRKLNEKLKKFTSRSRFDLKYERKLKIEGSPIRLIPVSQAQGDSVFQLFFIGMLTIEEKEESQLLKIDVLQKRIILILRSLIVLHKIAKKMLGGTIKNTENHLIDWFLGVLFEKRDGKAPVFGWIEIPFTSVGSLKELFGRAHLYVSKILVDPSRQSPIHTHSIAATLFAIWYEEIILKHIPLHLQNDIPHSSEVLLYKMAAFAD